MQIPSKQFGVMGAQASIPKFASATLPCARRACLAIADDFAISLHKSMLRVRDRSAAA
jgi:hypothetical protein